MSIITKMLKQTAVYWGNPIQDGYGGASFDAAVEIECRWEDKQELFIDADGKEVLSTAVVYVDRDVDLNGYLYLGTEAELDSDHSDPEIINGARMIKQFGKLPNFKAIEYLRTVWL